MVKTINNNNNRRIPSLNVINNLIDKCIKLCDIHFFMLLPTMIV